MYEVVHGITGSLDNKIGYEIERLGLKPGVAVTLNPSLTPSLNSELQYANERGLKIEKCDDGYYRWFKQSP